jgi:hypothetical protein
MSIDSQYHTSMNTPLLQASSCIFQQCHQLKVLFQKPICTLQIVFPLPTNFHVSFFMCKEVTSSSMVVFHFNHSDDIIIEPQIVLVHLVKEQT